MNNLIYEIKYKKDPEKNVLLSFNIQLFLFLYLIGAGSSLFFNDDTPGFIMMSIIFIPIILVILYWYLPVFESLSLYRSLKLYRDKIIINDDKEFDIKQVSTEIKHIHKGHRLISASWTSLSLYDENNSKIGEFFFAIDTKNSFFNTTEKSIAEIIEDIKKGKDYDFKNKIINDHKQVEEEKKSFNKCVVLLILVFIIPAIIGLIFVF